MITTEAEIYLTIKKGDMRSMWSIAKRLNMDVQEVIDVVYSSPMFWVVTGFGNWKYKNSKHYLVKRSA